jgi:hypothetical protein
VSFETLKKAEDDANEALQQRFLEDATAHHALATMQRWERRAAATEKQKREGGNMGHGRQALRETASRLGRSPSHFSFKVAYVIKFK